MTLNTLKSRIRKDMFQLRGIVCKKVSVAIRGELEMLIITRIPEFFKARQVISQVVPVRSRYDKSAAWNQEAFENSDQLLRVDYVLDNLVRKHKIEAFIQIHILTHSRYKSDSTVSVTAFRVLEKARTQV